MADDQDPIAQHAAALLSSVDDGRARAMVSAFQAEAEGASVGDMVWAVAQLQAALLAQLPPSQQFLTAAIFARLVADRLADLLRGQNVAGERRTDA